MPLAAVAFKFATVMSVPATVLAMAPPVVRLRFALFAGLTAPRTVIVPLPALPIASVPAVIRSSSASVRLSSPTVSAPSEIAVPFVD